MDFNLSMEKFAEKTLDKLEVGFKKVAFGLSEDIIMATPVDSGRARGNWFPEINTFSNQEDLKADDKKGSKAISKTKAKVRALKLGQTFTLTNNLPYIEKLEYGLYPLNPKYGTRYEIRDSDKFVTETGFVILSQGGFSTQAPQGMVRINLIKWQQHINNGFK